MSENVDSPVPEPVVPGTELPTLEGVSLHARRIVANRYEILSRLGLGGMGEVWHAYDLKLRVDVALKSLRLDQQRNDNRVEALRREVRTAREVISPNVCRIFDLVVEEDRELISMEYIDGVTLSAMLVKKGPMELREARDIAAQFLAGLEAIHQAGLVHRDLKPENIMITRTGRVVVMDFGIAKQIAQVGGTISGTPPYMSPEQLAGQKVDARSDVFAAGVVLAEMIHPEGVFSQKTREGIWDAVRKHPMQLPDTPWKAVIARAVAEKPENRFSSAGALARALEEVTLRVETVEERKPYPGLAAFTAGDAEYFFGRELEVETVIKKLQQLHLMALIGPSGAGKTSLLRAGLIPALPTGWSHVLCTPGDAPLVNLGQSLAPEFAGDTEAIRKMVRLDDIDVALWLLQRWRQNHPEALLIVDRFEELFTLNPAETQSQFAELIGRSVLDADIRVLLVMRDDFLIFCKEYLPLAPIFSELTAMLPLSGTSLRRALLQPGLKCGYRFEDETLVDEILADVEKERGALPLMAFAALKLWEKRDRQTGQLTRAAYKEIGGVAGALAQHAEQTMERIGTERQAIVREIFRNLITAQNTRAARDTEDLLSVFPEKHSAEEVLRALIDARLLTSFEAPQAEGENPKRRVEIIHESLLTNWPRLVRWQTQDADSAQLRDQLRQASQLWEQRSRSEDLLWTGAAYLEFQAWRQRYSGGLSTSEEAFAQAMMQRANKRRKQRQFAVITLLVALLLILALIGNFWQREKNSRQIAETETQRAEASKFLALAQLEAAAYPGGALAYAIKSLEVFDTLESRLFAVKITQENPVPMIMPANQGEGLESHRVDFSPDGVWLAACGYRKAQIRSKDGAEPQVLREFGKSGSICHVQFGRRSDRLFASLFDEIRISSIPSGKELAKWNISTEGHSRIFRTGKGFIVLMLDEAKGTLYYSPDEETKPEYRGEIPTGPTAWMNEDFLYTDEQHKKVYSRSLENWSAPPEMLLDQSDEILGLAMHPEETELATTDASGQIRIWALDHISKQPIRTFESSNLPSLRYDPTGRFLAAGGYIEGEATFKVWDRSVSFVSAPLVLSRPDAPNFYSWSFHPSGEWLAVGTALDVPIWPLTAITSKVLTGHSAGMITGLAFSADSRYLLSTSDDGTVRKWPLQSKETMEIVLQGSFLFPRVAIDKRGERFAVSARGAVLLSSINGGDPRRLAGFSKNSRPFPVAFDDSGRFIASGPVTGPKEEKGIWVWDLETEQMKVLGPVSGAGEGFEGAIMDVKFIDQDTLLASGGGGLQRFDINKNTSEVLSAKPHGQMALSNDKKFLIVSQCEKPRGEAQCKYVKRDLVTNTTIDLKAFGDGFALALGPKDQVLATQGFNGVIRIGKMSNEEPYIFFGPKGPYNAIAISSDGRWIAAAGLGTKIHLIPMPDLSKPPPHTLPHDELMKKLKSFTNLRVAPDAQSSTGWKVETGPFPGWEKVPTW